MIFLAGTTVIDADPDFVVSCVDVAVMVAVPAATPVTLPEDVTVAAAEFEDDQFTPELNVPVPVTWALHCALAPLFIEEGEQVTITAVIVEDAVTVTLAEPDLVVSSVDVAVIVAVPVETPVTLPEELIVAAPVLEDAQVTAELKLPVPVTVAVHEAEDPAVTDDGQVTETAVIVGCGGGGDDDPPPLLPPPQALIRATSDATRKPVAIRKCFRFIRLTSRNLLLRIL